MLYRVLPLPLLAALALLASAALATPPPAPSPVPPAIAVAQPARLSWFHRRRHGAEPAWLAAANPLAVDAGLEILGKGGNAIDAAVAGRRSSDSAGRRAPGSPGGALS